MTPILRFIRDYPSRYWPWYLVGAVCLWATNWLAVQIPLELAVAVDALRADPAEAAAVLLHAAQVIAAMGAAVIGVRTLSRVLYFTPGRLVEYQLKNDLFAHMMALPASFYGKWTTGDLVSRASNDITYLRVLSGFGALQVVNITVALLLAGNAMLNLSPRLTVVVAVPILLCMGLVQFGIRKLFDLTRLQQEQLAGISDHVLASLQGIRTIQGFNAEAAFEARLDTQNADWLRTHIQLARIRAFVLPLLMLGGGLAVWGLLAIGGPMAAEGALSVGQLVAFTTYVAYLLPPLRSLGWLLSVLQRGMTSLERLDEVLTQPLDKEGALASPRGAAPAFELRNLGFRYPDAEEPTLTGLTATIAAGTTVGIFGRTGSGKSTLLQLLTREWNPPRGTIFADGVDVLDLDLNGWRQRLAVAPQVPFLFSETVADNIAMGVVDPAGVADVLDRAALTGDLRSLPQGVDTLVGERGVMLSGGQRQRTALARALYRDFDVLVLDDVLSAVDHGTEQRLIHALAAVGQGRHRPTVWLVSNRTSALVHADTVLVLEEGRLADQGTHAELIGRPGPYQDAWRHQSVERPEPEPVTP